MPKPYPDPSFNTTTAMFTHVNNVTNNWATLLVIMVVPFIVIITMIKKGYTLASSFTAGFWIAFLESSFFWSAGVLPGKIVVLLLLSSIASLIYQIFTD